MRKLLLLLFLCAMSNLGRAQAGYVLYVSSAPSGTCSQGSYQRVVIGPGTVYTCQSGTWTQVGSGAGSVTSIATTSPIGGGTITGTGTLTCTTCLFATTPTNHGVLLGKGTQESAFTAAGTTGQVLTGVTGSDPTWQAPAGSTTGGCDPTQFVCIYDDFIGFVGSSADNTLFSTGQSFWRLGVSVSGSIAFSNSNAGTYGTIEMVTGAASPDGVTIDATGTSSNGSAPYNATTFDTHGRFSISTTSNISSFIGFTSHNSLGEGNTTYIGIGYDTNQSDASWKCVTKSGGTATRTAITGTLNTAYHTFRIRSTVAGTILCSEDGGAETTVNTNVPSSNLVPELAITERTNSASTMSVDYFQHWYAITR